MRVLILLAALCAALLAFSAPALADGDTKAVHYYSLLYTYPSPRDPG
jgi:hypothetical protein